MISSLIGREMSIEAWGAAMLGLGSVLSFAMAPPVRALAIRLGWTDQADGTRKLHRRPTARVGGLCLVVPFVVGTTLVSVFLTDDLRAAALLKEWFWMIGGCVAMFGLGMIDDIWPQGAKVKLAGQAAVCAAVAAFGFKIGHLTDPLSLQSIDMGWLAFPVAFFWLLATTNLINLIDGIDGLAAGISLFVLTVLALTSAMTAGAGLLMVCLLMIGALTGFLFFNFPPARLFMGDGGAYFLGFLIGEVGLACNQKSSIVAALIVPILALGVPIIDTALAIIRRGVRGLPIFRADREHIHHRLIDMGLSPRRVVLGLYAVCAMLSVAGMVVFLRRGKGIELALGLVFLVALVAVLGLGYFRDTRVWQQVTEALGARSRTARLVESCRQMVAEARRKRDPGALWTRFVALAGEAGFCLVVFKAVHGNGSAQAAMPPVGAALPELEKLEMPVIVGKKTVGTLALGAPTTGYHQRLTPRHAHLLRDALADALAAANRGEA